MKLHNMLPFRSWTFGITLLSLSIRVAHGLSQEYCSTQNTGSDFGAVSNIWQSNGLCHDTCNGQNYAFAIVQYQSCWCSNYIPASQDGTDNCSEDCPGYPDEQCGDKNGGYFGYIALDAQPSGTAGAASSSAPSSTSQPTTTKAPPPSTTSSSTSSMVTSTSTPHTTEMTATPVTSVLMTTVSGNVVTQTVTTTPMVIPGSHQDTIPIQRDQGLSGGAIAGIVIGVLAGVAILAAAAFLLWRRKRNAGDPENNGSGFSSAKKSPTRNVSVLSKAGLLARTRPSMGEREHDDSFYGNGTNGQNSVRHSMLFAGAEVSPTSPLDSSHSNDSRRTSKPMVYDQRLNPSALFANHENGSRISMQDQQDYSRPLGVMNPDPRASFESRLH